MKSPEFTKRLSVFVITHNRVNLLKRCCESILEALPENCELIVVLNGADPDTEEWLTGESDSRLRWSVIEKRDRSSVRNEAWMLSRSKIVHFLDDDLTVPKDIFDRSLEAFDSHPELAVLGGPNLTPHQSSKFEFLCGELLASPVTCPLVFGRYRASDETKSRTAENFMIGCNFAINLDRIPSSIRFRPRLISNEENLFSYRCTQRGLKTLFVPNVAVYHHRRSSLIGFLRQVFSYGRGRGQQLSLYPGSCNVLFLVPALVLLVIPFMSLHFMTGFTVAYFGIQFIGALLSSRYLRHHPMQLLKVPLLSSLIHVVYGSGLLVSLMGYFCSKPMSLFRRIPELSGLVVDTPHRVKP